MSYRYSALEKLERSLKDTGLQISTHELIGTSNKQIPVDILVKPDAPIIDVVEIPQKISQYLIREKIFRILERPYFWFTPDQVHKRFSDIAEYVSEVWRDRIGVKK